MLTMIVAALALAGIPAASPAPAVHKAAATAQAPAEDCLHDRRESTGNRDRRERALRVAAAINAAEVRIIGPKPTQKYQPLDRLFNVPATPPGFVLRFYLAPDASSYLFSLRDTLDACHYTVFSDQDGRIYDGTARRGAFVLPTSDR
jgi:hypothetical protein